MRPDEADRRRAPRRIPQPGESLARARLRTGRELTVIDISSSGALVEGLTRLLPGTRADVHFVTRHGRVLVRTRIIRSLVWRLEPDAVCYRSALAFDTAVDTDFASNEPVLSERRESNGLALSERSESSGLALSERSEPSGLGLSERSEPNGSLRESKGYELPGEILGNHEGAGIHYPSAEVDERV
jgi:hypothetical protein